MERGGGGREETDRQRETERERERGRRQRERGRDKKYGGKEGLKTKCVSHIFISRHFKTKLGYQLFI